MALLKRLNSKMEDLKQSPLISNTSQRQSQLSLNFQWFEIKSNSNILNKRAHHASTIIGHQMFVYGGYQAGGIGILDDFFSFDLNNKQWKSVLTKKSAAGARHSHSLVSWNNKLYLFGGIFNTFQSTNKLHSFSIGTSNDWKQQLCTGQMPPPLNSHKTVVYKDQLIVFGGQQQQKFNEWIYSLNLIANQWKKVYKFTQRGIKPRSDFSMSSYNNKAYIFGGKNDDVKYNQLWQLNLDLHTFKQINTDVHLKPTPRSGHCACIYQDYLLIFGGTAGITHQKNDLLIFNIKQNFWQRHWPDEQSEINKEMFCSDNDNLPRSLKKSRSNSFTKKTVCSTFGPNSNDKSSECQKLQCSNANTSPQKKYRGAMKQQNYYNENYPFYGDKQGLLGSKHKKNDLLVDLQKETKQDSKYNQGTSKNSRKVQLHLSQTFESLNNSILTSLVQNGGKLDVGNLSMNEEKVIKQKVLRQPKPRDGHSCQIYGRQMIIFGGDRHHMSFNDVIMLNLQRVISSQSKSIGKVQVQEQE